MKPIVFILLALCSTVVPRISLAQGLFHDSCSFDTNPSLPYYIKLNSEEFIFLTEAQSHQGPILSCQNIKQMGNAYELAELALMPAIVALSAPGVRTGLGLELARLGLTAANPAVLAVTVIGVSGVAVFRIVLKQKMEDCVRMERGELKKQIIQELERKYGLKQKSSLPLTMEY